MARLSGAAAFLILYALFLRAQTPPQPVREVVIRTHPYTPPSTTLHAESDLVESGLTVRDSRGRTVAGLHATDFEVLDNKVPQQIVGFSELRSDGQSTAPAPGSGLPSGAVPPANAPPAEPKFVTFFFDDFHTGNGEMQFVKQAARAFIAKGLRPRDWMSIVTTSGEGDLDFTNDAKLFAEKLEHWSSHNRYVVPSFCGVSPVDSYIFLHNLDGQVVEEAIAAAEKPTCAGCSKQDTPQQCRAKAIPIAQQAASSAWEQLQAQSLDTVFALGFAAKRLSEVNGTRILVLTSSGFLLRPGVQPELANFIDEAVRWNIAVHAIGAQGLEARMTGPKDSLRRELFLMPLENIANGTGGHYFRDNNDIAGDMELAANPAVAYLLAFKPGNPDGKFHTLKIRFKTNRADSLEFRPGYFSRTDESEKALTARAPLDEAVFSKQTLHDFPATVTLGAGQPKDGTRNGPLPVSIGVTVDINRLQFTTANGRHMQQLVLLMTLLDAGGNFVTGKESIMDLALRDEKLASLKKDGLKTVATLNAPAGIYQVRTIIREGMKGGLSASTTAVELPAK
jgi:VWFA-related protein